VSLAPRRNYGLSKLQHSPSLREATIENELREKLQRVYNAPAGLL
jgi:hypothetical protein